MKNLHVIGTFKFQGDPQFICYIVRNAGNSNVHIFEVVIDQAIRDIIEKKMFHSLENERWYGGRMNSDEAAKLLTNAGDFLVRESTSTKGQFVLTVRNAKQVIHLNLLGKDGSIKNKTRSFKSIKEFIDYHTGTKNYIVIGDEKYFLGQPSDYLYAYVS